MQEPVKENQAAAAAPSLNETVAARAAELSTKYACEVVPLIFRDDVKNEDVIGFFKMPNRPTKMRLLDKGMTSPVSAAGDAFELLLIREESDPRFYSEKSEDDRFYIGGATAVFATVQVSVNQFKKN